MVNGRYLGHKCVDLDCAEKSRACESPVKCCCWSQKLIRNNEGKLNRERATLRWLTSLVSILTWWERGRKPEVDLPELLQKLFLFGITSFVVVGLFVCFFFYSKLYFPWKLTDFSLWNTRISHVNWQQNSLDKKSDRNWVCLIV